MKKAALILASALLSSCIGTDIGGTLHDMGLSEPKALPAGENADSEIFPFNYTGELYQKDGELYIEIPIVYVPQQGIWVECYCPLNNLHNKCTYRHVPTLKEMQALPAKPHFFRVKIPSISNKKDLRRFNTSHELLDLQNITPVVSFDKTTAQHLGSMRLNIYNAHNLAMSLPVQRTWYNHALRPLSYIGRVIDTASVLTIGTLSLPIIHGFEPECLRPKHDITGSYRMN